MKTKFSYDSSKDCYQVAAFYSFTPLTEENISFLLEGLQLIGHTNQLMGTVLIASEGVNGTICGSVNGVADLLESLNNALSEGPLEVKFSWTSTQVFRRLKIRRKKEIVTMGIPNVNPRSTVGTYVSPDNWNDLIEEEDTLVIDTRNDYEVAIGSFEGALNPQTKTFSEFPQWVDDNLVPLVRERAPKRIALFCTGGIRCEKATSYLKDRGFDDVYHLYGGILRYLEEVPQQESLWKGECFVFDQRVALNHDLQPGMHVLCYACGLPLSPQDLEENSYILGVQCHNCKDHFSDQDRLRFAERQRQLDGSGFNKNQVSSIQKSSK